MAAACNHRRFAMQCADCAEDAHRFVSAECVEMSRQHAGGLERHFAFVCKFASLDGALRSIVDEVDSKRTDYRCGLIPDSRPPRRTRGSRCDAVSRVYFMTNANDVRVL
jgi:hypothetical protein